MGADGVGPHAAVGWVAIEGERIAALAAGDAPPEWRARAGRTIDARHMAVLPGLVNGHTHLSQTFMRGLADGRPLLRWLQEVIWPLQAAMTADDLYVAALLGLAENLRCGATTVVQHHKLPGREHVEAVIRAAEQIGIRLVLARGWIDLGPSAEPLERILADLEWLHGLLRARAAGRPERIRLASGPLVPWRCSDNALRETTALVRSWGAGTHIHVAETQDEIEMLLRRCGRRHIEWLADLDLLGPDMQLVHAVHVSDAELDLIAHSGATVVHCPTSNMYLASGAAPVCQMLERGIAVALGTDGSGSNHSQDLLECAKIAALLAKHATGNAQALLPEDVLAMLTTAGARLWDRAADKAGWGRLGVDAPADITIVNLDNVRCQPVHSTASALVYNASGADIHTVIVGGEVLVDAGRLTTVDEAALCDEARRAAHGLLRRAGVGRTYEC